MDENLLLSLIENNAKMEVVDLAAALNETEENVDKTIKDLEKNKTIYGYHTLINWDKTNHDVCTAVIQVNAKPERDYGYDLSLIHIYFTLIQVIHCVPRHFHGFSSAAAIHMTSSGKHIIVSNRGHDSIVLYRVNQETGKITLLYMVHTGKGPRDFNIIDDRYIVVASQEDDRLELYTFDEEKEEIKPTGNTLDIIQPVCVAL